MKITKFGHCCLLIEESGLCVLTDPGAWSEGYESVRDIDLVLITHEHQDHFHLEALQKVLAANPEAKVVTNSAVGALMQKDSLAFELLEHGQAREDKGVKIEGVGTEHAVIHSSLPVVMNTGYFIGGKMFYPGDALTDPERPVDILALPVAGPWLKISEAIDYARALKPRIWLPVHDAILNVDLGYRIAAMVLDPMGIPGKKLEHGQEEEF